jgi:hypothetical protein
MAGKNIKIKLSFKKLNLKSIEKEWLKNKKSSNFKRFDSTDTKE